MQVLKHTGAVTDIEWNAFLHGGTLKVMSKSTNDFSSVAEEGAGIPGTM